MKERGGCENKKLALTSYNESSKMTKFQRFEKDQELRREELIRNIEYSISQLSVAELESLYYDMMTKQYMGKNQEG